MRHFSLLLTAAACGLVAVAAAAQDAQPPTKAEPPAAQTGLSNLNDTVSQLRDEQQQTEAPAPADAPPAAPAPASESPPPAAEPVATPPATPPVHMLTGPAMPLTRSETAQVAEIVARGRLIGSIARSGQIATQDMLSRVPNPDSAGISGWIAMPEGNGTTVTFYADGVDGAP